MWNSAVLVTFWLFPMLATMASLRAQAPGSEQTLPRPTTPLAALWLLVAVPSALQMVQPHLLEALRRDWPLITEGQVWRLVTSVVVQDGGASGTVFNLVILALVLLAAQGYWKPAWVWAMFWVGGLAPNCVVGPGLAPTGAGNSMATFVVAAALAVSILLGRPERSAALPAVGALACVSFMLVAGNYHGAAALVGVAVGFLPVLRREDRAKRTVPAAAFRGRGRAGGRMGR